MNDETSWLDGSVAQMYPVERRTKPIKVKPTVKAKVIAKREERQRPRELVQAEHDLTPIQRILLSCVLSSVSIREANQKFRTLGYTTSHDTLRKWRKSPAFIRAMDASYAYLNESVGLSREGILHKLEQLREDAVTPVPILYQGEDTGFEERDRASAIKILEQQAKILKLYEDSKESVAVNLNIDFGSYGDPVIEGEVVGRPD